MLTYKTFHIRRGTLVFFPEWLEQQDKLRSEVATFVNKEVGAAQLITIAEISAEDEKEFIITLWYRTSAN